MDVYVSGRRVRVDPQASIGKGGEADVFDISDEAARTVLKLWKTPDHPDYAGLPIEQQAARARLDVNQQKLRAMPRDLPSGIVGPIDLATDRSGKKIVGFTMRYIEGAEVLLRYAEPSQRRGGLLVAHAIAALLDLHRTVEALHARGFVIGDFNDLNVLVHDARALLIDADSLQFGSFLCRVYTERFVDPAICDSSAAHPTPVRPFTPDSDWYAFAVMLMQSLLCVGPHGGVFRPADPAARVPQTKRPLARITVFHPEVVYPKPAIPLRVLPDDLLGQFERIFVHDQRGVFPRALLEGLRFTRCASCGAEHARAVCPGCVLTARAAVIQTTAARGRVTSTRFFETRGVIVFATVQEGALVFVSYEGGRYVREDGADVMRGGLDPRLSFAIQGRTTIVGRGAEAFAITPGRAPDRIAVDVFEGRPVLRANARRCVFARGGRLYRGGFGNGLSSNDLASRLARDDATPFGEVLSGQTRLWLGDRFGLGFYRAGTISIAFVFDADRGGLVDTVKLPFLPGEITHADCVFDHDRAFVLIAARHRGRVVHQCVAVARDGQVIAAAEGAGDDGTWLGTIGGKCAAGGALLAATEAGVVRIEPRGGALVETRAFPDTEPFVDPETRLFAGAGGLFAVAHDNIHALRFA